MSSSALKAHDDKILFKAHNDSTNLSRNTKRACAACGPHGGGEHVVETDLKVCTGCRRIWYCSGDCQKKDWKRHKPFCQIHQRQQAAMDQDAQTLSAIGTQPNMPSLNVLRDMLADFANLHHRVISVVVGHELGKRSNAFPPLDFKTDCISLSLKLRDPDANPASIYEFTGGVVPCPLNSLDSEKQQLLALYAEKLSEANIHSSTLGMFFIPALLRVERPPFVYITTVELRRDHLDLNLLKKTVPDDAPWWAQLDYNAQKGLVVRRHWNDRFQTYVELLGTLKQKEADIWRWEKAEDSRGNQRDKEELRERKKLFKK
ncbi:hypothetical protein PENSPDRAFT_680306 [Peniophora sp. CONT]|nr:hypothetical protein PENSPDRAFT_680306 [Peniophora sp. CONT]